MADRDERESEMIGTWGRGGGLEREFSCKDGDLSSET